MRGGGNAYISKPLPAQTTICIFELSINAKVKVHPSKRVDNSQHTDLYSKYLKTC